MVSPEPVEGAVPISGADSEQLNDSHNALNQLSARSVEGGTLFHGTIGEPGKVFVQKLDGGGAVVESVEAALYGGNEFYANLDLASGSHTVRIIARDIHGETSTQDYSCTVAADPGDTFTHDAAGNLTHWTKSDGTQIEYKWDAANRLCGIIVDSLQIQSFEYDGAGRMTRATDASSNRNDYYWDGLERLARENVDVSPTVERRYLTQGFTESLDGAAATNYYVTRDHLGSTREVLDDTYAVVARYDYGPWGEVEKLSGTIDADRLYTGHLHFADSETPLHLAPYRAYQPELGRWLSRDYVGELNPDGSNLYGYVRNTPVNDTDPTGLRSTLGESLLVLAAFEAASTTLDVAQAVNVVANDCSSAADITNALGAVALGVIAPGPGTAYTKATNGAVDGLRAVAGNKGNGIFTTGINITPIPPANKFTFIGRGNRTFVTEPSVVESVIGPLPNSNRMTISSQQARRLESALGLNANSLEARNIISIVDDIPSRRPASPISGNNLFQGGGAGLPGGGAELTIQGIPSAGGAGIRQIILEVAR